ATLTGEWEVATVGRGRLSASAGLTFVSLIFRLQGTLAPTTASQETREDFVTQELPVPVLGLGLAPPRASRLDAGASALVGYLPWVNSLRHEGGEVSLRQRHLDLALDLTYALTPALRAGAGYRYSWFEQHEESNEDGNDIALGYSGIFVG